MFSRATRLAVNAAAILALGIGSNLGRGGYSVRERARDIKDAVRVRLHSRSARGTRYLRATKGWTGGDLVQSFKGSSLAKRGARMAAKRAKANRRVRGARKADRAESRRS